MFHRSTAQPQTNKPNTSSQTVENSSEQAPNAKFQPQEPQRRIYRQRVESSAVQRYAKSSSDPMPSNTEQANQNTTHNVQQNVPSQVVNSMLDVDNGNNNFKPNPHNPIENEKEVNPMNSPETQAKKTTPEADKAAAPQNRDVNIPGNNFQRPGAPVPGRPAYPGSFGTGAPANAPYPSAGMDSGRKLVIGEGITMSGEIESCEHLIVQGTIEAVLKGASLLDVSQTGAFLGTVEIDEANIAGRFEGDITVKGRLTIESTGEVVGSISYKELSMEAGAVIDGSVSPIGSTNAMANKKAAAPAKSKKASVNNGAELPFSDGNKADAAQ